MPLIQTITLNPAVDISSETELVRPTHKVRTVHERLEPGGGAINVARVVRTLGGDAEVLFLGGGATGALLDDLLGRQGLKRRMFQTEQPTRIAFTVHEKQTGLEYRFVPEGPLVTAHELEPCLEAIRSSDAAYVVASGSLPRGVDPGILTEIAGMVADRGGRFILDSSGPGLRTTLQRARVFLVKPAISELEDLVGRPLDEIGARDAAHDIVKSGAAELVAITMGANGAMLVSRQGALRLPAPRVVVHSAVGAGDSFVGAMTWALSNGQDPVAAFHLGVAAGAAAVMTSGTELARREDIFRLLSEANDQSATGMAATHSAA